MRQTIVTAALILSLAACGQDTSSTATDRQIKADTIAESSLPQAKNQSQSEQLNKWFEERYEAQLMMSPMSLTSAGRKERYDEIDDMSEAAAIKQLEWKRNSVVEMKQRFDYEQLNEDAKLSYDLWEYQYKQWEKGAEFRRSGYRFNQMFGVQSYYPTFLRNFHKVESLADMQAYVSRISELGRAMNQQIERAKLSAAEGVRPPRFAYEVVLDEARAIIAGAPFNESETDSTLWDDVTKKIGVLVDAGTITAAQSEQLMQSARTALLESFGPSYQNLIAFVESDIGNTSEQPQGVHANPNGDAYYAHRLNLMTTTDLTADQIHQLGLSEVKRLRLEMQTLKEKSGFNGSLKQFFAFIRDSKDDRRFYFPNTDEGRQGYIDQATAAIDNIKKELPNYFGILPKAGLVVKRVEPFREQDGAPQHYYAGTADGSRDGIYYAHLSDMSTMTKVDLEVIAYHEGLPGHHMQISIAQELTGVPTFRTKAFFTVYAEGWGLYAEKLAKEMPNTFTDVYSDFGRLQTEMWRAIRLVVDTGLHSKKWTEQQAIEYFTANSAKPLATVRTEVRRYMVMPGQATAYKIGMIEIQRLRTKAETELGQQFDIKAFHDTILDGGAMPLNMLDRKVSAWIASQK